MMDKSEMELLGELQRVASAVGFVFQPGSPRWVRERDGAELSPELILKARKDALKALDNAVFHSIEAGDYGHQLQVTPWPEGKMQHEVRIEVRRLRQ